jgi:hypothetical protein
VQQGFRDALERGALTGHQVTGCKFVLEDGAAHQVDSSELAFRLAAQGAFREAFPKGRPVVLEPVMKVDITAPIEFQGEFPFFVQLRGGVELKGLLGGQATSSAASISGRVRLSTPKSGTTSSLSCAKFHSTTCLAVSRSRAGYPGGRALPARKELGLITHSYRAQMLRNSVA